MKTQYRDRGMEYLMIRAEHIWKENDILYMMGRRLLMQADKDSLVRRFHVINLATYGENAVDKFDSDARGIGRGW